MGDMLVFANYFHEIFMKAVVAKLTDEDFVNIAAYVSSRPPDRPR